MRNISAALNYFNQPFEKQPQIKCALQYLVCDSIDFISFVLVFILFQW